MARKLFVRVWRLLMGLFTSLIKVTGHLCAKLLGLATMIAKDGIKAIGLKDRDAFVKTQSNSIQPSP